MSILRRADAPDLPTAQQESLEDWIALGELERDPMLLVDEDALAGEMFVGEVLARLRGRLEKG